MFVFTLRAGTPPSPAGTGEGLLTVGAPAMSLPTSHRERRILVYARRPCPPHARTTGPRRAVTSLGMEEIVIRSRRLACTLWNVR